jgi:hypothetical protein
MNPRVKVLKELVAGGHYVVDEGDVADAMLLRSRAALVLPDLTFRCTASEAPPAPKVRSFRPHRGARSFRLNARGTALGARAQRRPPAQLLRLLPQFAGFAQLKGDESPPRFP